MEILETAIVGTYEENTWTMIVHAGRSRKQTREIRELIRENCRLRRLYAARKEHESQQALNRNGAKLCQALKVFDDQRWRKKLEELNPRDNSAW